MNTAAQRAAAYLEQRAAAGNVRERIASPRLYPERDTQDLTLADLQELIATSLDIEQHIKDIKAAAWDEGALWMWEAKEAPAPRDNPYRD